MQADNVTNVTRELAAADGRTFDSSEVRSAIEELPFVEPGHTVVRPTGPGTLVVGFRSRSGALSDLEGWRVAERVAERFGLRVERVHPCPDAVAPDRELAVLQAIRLKGRPTAADIAAVAGLPEAAVVPLLPALVGRHVVETGGRYRLTTAGRARLAELAEGERVRLDRRAVGESYDRFHSHNAALKAIVTDWQIKDGSSGPTPNDHADPVYDSAVVDRLVQLHEEFASLLAKLVILVPRLAPYPDRFAAALARIRAGDHAWLARPMIDSYHTVWFELHEDLIGLTGRTRLAEAVAGRAE